MLVTKEIEGTPKLTKEQREMLEHAKKIPVTFDEDTPELTEEDLKKFYRVKELNRAERNKQNVTIRLSPRALRKAKSLGKGYTSVLSRILENALDNNDIIKQYL